MNPVKNLFRNIKNFLKGKIDERFHQKVDPNPQQQVSSARYSKKHKPSWWRRLYNVGKRTQAGLLNRHVVKFQGSFRPIRRFNVTRTKFNMRYKIGFGK